MSNLPRVSTRTTLASSLLLAALLTGAPGYAQAPTADAKTRETARSLYKLGNEHFREERFKDALEAYEGAEALMKVPSTSFKVGLALSKMGRLIEARDRLVQVSLMPVQENEPAPMQKAREDAKALASELDGKIPRVTVVIEGAPDGAAVNMWIDGKEVPKQLRGLPQKVDPGRHTIAVRVGSDAKRQKKLTLRLSEKRTVTFELESEPLPSEVAPAPDEKADDTSSGGVHILVPVGFGVAGAGVIVGIATGVTSLNAASEAKTFCNEAGQCSPEAQDPLDTAGALAPVSTASFVIAGVGAALGVVGLVLGGDDEPSPAVGFVAPLPGGAAAFAQGRF